MGLFSGIVNGLWDLAFTDKYDHSSSGNNDDPSPDTSNAESYAPLTDSFGNSLPDHDPKQRSWGR